MDCNIPVSCKSSLDCTFIFALFSLEVRRRTLEVPL